MKPSVLKLNPNSTVNRHGLDGSRLRRVGWFGYSQNDEEQEMRVMNS